MTLSPASMGLKTVSDSTRQDSISPEDVEISDVSACNEMNSVENDTLLEGTEGCSQVILMQPSAGCIGDPVYQSTPKYNPDNSEPRPERQDVDTAAACTPKTSPKVTTKTAEAGELKCDPNPPVSKVSVDLI